eukprot:7660363-Ditylum_brightwellii.AAC.1
MQGAAGPGDVDLIAWQGWLLCFCAASCCLHKSVAAVACWLANTLPAWAAYRAIVTGRLIALDKCPGVCPVGVGEILLCMLSKCIIPVCGEEATTVCSTHQLCLGLKASIKGAIHAMKQLWDNNSEEDSWGILLVDAKNAFNKINHCAMLWSARYLWVPAARFAINIYYHWQKLVWRGHPDLVMSKEGVTQGDPIAMILYALDVLPLFLQLEELISTLEDITNQLQKWFDDDSALGSFFATIKT